VHEEIKFHTDRALAEIDLASHCHDHRAAEAHLGLSAMHLERMRELTEQIAIPPFGGR
jgi:hypothetical protein